MKNFLNYFASKTILLNILQNVTIYLLHYFLEHITVIPQNDTFLCCRTNKILLQNCVA